MLGAFCVGNGERPRGGSGRFSAAHYACLRADARGQDIRELGRKVVLALVTAEWLSATVDGPTTL